MCPNILSKEHLLHSLLLKKIALVCWGCTFNTYHPTGNQCKDPNWLDQVFGQSKLQPSCVPGSGMDVQYHLDTVSTASLAGPHSFLKAAQWCMKPKWLDFPGLKIPGSEAALPHHWANRASALESLRLFVCEIRVEPATSGFALC